MTSKRDFVKIANKYIDDVLSGEISACKFVKQACERQKKDLSRKRFKYHFDNDRATRVCKFIELLPHIKGEWAGKSITLEPWQVFILTTCFGWIDKKEKRRFKKTYIEVPRKNAKSTLSSGVALYCLAMDGEAGAEVYSAATTRDQARIVFNDAKNMVSRTTGLRKRQDVKVSAHAIYQESTASSFKALSRDQGGNLDGLNVHCAIIDELHAHKTREVYDVIDTSTGSRSQPLIWAITTAGFNRAGICYESRADVIKILNGTYVDHEIFGIIFTIDENDDWTEKENWIKANPNWGVSVNPEDIERKARRAIRQAGATNNFLTKHLNQWVNANTAWVDMRAWEKCANSKKIEDFLGKSCHLGLDLATTTDIAALSIVFNENGEFHEFHRYFIPEDTVYESTNSQYQGWARSGHLIQTEGNITDYLPIEEEIKDIAANYHVLSVAYDEWQANYLATRLMTEGLNMVKFPMSTKNLSEPMKELEKQVLSKNFNHDGCPVYAWMASNVVGHYDTNENIKPLKEFPQNKIDGIVATIMAMGRWLEQDESAGVSLGFV